MPPVVRPTTSSGGPPPHHYPPAHSNDLGMYNNPEYDVQEEFEDSEDEDVFAFLAPTTADQQRERDEQEQRLQAYPSGDSNGVEGDAATVPVSMPIADTRDSNPFAHSPPVLPKSTFNFYSNNAQIPEPSNPGPITTLPQSFPAERDTPSYTISDTTSHAPPYHPTDTPTSPIPTTANSDIPRYSVSDVHSLEGRSAPYPYPSLGVTVETPPSTGSQGDYHGNPNANAYRLRRVNTNGSTRSNNQTNPSSPPTRDIVSFTEEKDVSQSTPNIAPLFANDTSSRAKTGDDMSRRRRKKSLPDTIGTSVVQSHSGVESITPSMLEEDSTGSIKMEFDFDAIDEEDSPFPEVRASVSNIDDPEMPTLTVRMWLIGLALCFISSTLNVFFNFRQPGPQVAPLVLLLISYPIGKLLAYTLPITTYRIPLPHSFSPIIISLNPGPWNIKEHVLVYIMANVATAPPYAMNAIVVIEHFYGIHFGYWFNLTLVLATQLTGFGLAGLCRRFLVWPASMVWPQNLVVCALLNTLHAEDDEGQGGMTRYRFFMIVTAASFVYFFLPGFLFQALSIFSFVCWIAPRNVVVNQLFGTANGLGMSVLTFDWSQITWIGSPLMVPWWAEVHVFIGFALFYWILTPILYYTNVWEFSHFPITGNVPYDRFGDRYDIHRVLTPEDTFNLTAYQEYSPLYLPATYAVTYLLAFALSTNVIVHTLLYHGRSLWKGLKRIRVEDDDIHAKLMRHYPEVPDWWYGAAFLLFFSMAVVAVEVWQTKVPVWALVLAVSLPIVYVLPSGFIFAMTGQGISLNLLAQIIPGTLLPGNPVANMVFKAYSVQTLSETTSFVQDLKLGHYVKVPPRATFLVQSVSTTLVAFMQVGVKVWLFAHVRDICTDQAENKLTCPHNQVFFTASAVWGLIGPSRQFGKGSLYHPQLYAIIAGALVPVPFWLWYRRHPDSWIRYVSTPVVLTGIWYIPPATGINYSSWFAVGFIFQFWVRRRNFAWWSKFNYILSAALDSGMVISLMVIFVALQLPKGGVNVSWFGNNVFKNTADYDRTPFRPIPSGSALPWPS